MSSQQAETTRVAPFGVRRTELALETGEKWYALQSLPRQEAKAELNLLRQGFRVFVPRTMQTVKHARKLRTVASAFFPGYLFVKLDLQRDRWRSINGTFGVARIVMASDRPQPVPGGVVERLLDCADDGGLLIFGRELQEGQSVRVVAGPFVNALGCLMRLDAGGRVRVLLDIMNGKIPAELHRSAIEAA